MGQKMLPNKTHFENASKINFNTNLSDALKVSDKFFLLANFFWRVYYGISFSEASYQKN